MLSKSLRKEILKLQTRQGRKKSPYYLAEGLRCCEEALKIKLQVEAIVVEESFDQSLLPELADQDFSTASTKDFREMAQTENPQGVMMLIERPKMDEIAFSDPFTLVLDGVGEPGNMGTILRTAKAIGLTEVILTRGSVDPFNAKSVRSGMGAQFSLDILIVESLAELKSSERFQDKQFWLTTPHDGTSCYSDAFTLAGNVLVMGAEANGIEDFSVGEKVRIPMPGGSESLNVAQAATIFLFEGVRRGITSSL